MKVQNVKLLIIEDDIDQLELIRDVLEDHFGIGTVRGVSSRAEALRENLSQFDLILADYNLPDADGIALLDELHQHTQTPIIIVTGENVGQTAAEAFRRGAADYIVKLGDYLMSIPLIVEKNLKISREKHEKELLQKQLLQKNHQLEAALRRVEELAATDPLTGLYNRRHFSHVIEQLFAQAQRHDYDLACIMVDLDGYKQLNDAHGHQVGDQLLVLAGKVIRTNMRIMDVAARYGGDEFVLLLPQASTQQAATVGRRIRDEFFAASAMLLQCPCDRGVTMSMGIACLRINHPPTADQLVAIADTALYTAKGLGRDRIHTSSIISATLSRPIPFHPVPTTPVPAAPTPDSPPLSQP